MNYILVRLWDGYALLFFFAFLASHYIPQIVVGTGNLMLRPYTHCTMKESGNRSVFLSGGTQRRALLVLVIQCMLCYVMLFYVPAPVYLVVSA